MKQSLHEKRNFQTCKQQRSVQCLCCYYLPSDEGDYTPDAIIKRETPFADEELSPLYQKPFRNRSYILKKESVQREQIFSFKDSPPPNKKGDMYSHVKVILCSAVPFLLSKE